VLDGGHVVFLLYEGITRRKPSERVRMALQQLGFVIIIAIFILVTFNDVLRLF
jgi:regulator of sigma E protease